MTSDTNRLLPALERVRAKVEELDAAATARLDATLAVDFEDHFAYQEAQAHAHASGKLRPAEAQMIYASLGHVGSADNGGWAAGTDLATKVVVTQAIGELLGARIEARR